MRRQMDVEPETEPVITMKESQVYRVAFRRTEDSRHALNLSKAAR